MSVSKHTPRGYIPPSPLMYQLDFIATNRICFLQNIKSRIQVKKIRFDWLYSFRHNDIRATILLLLQGDKLGSAWFLSSRLNLIKKISIDKNQKPAEKDHKQWNSAEENILF